MKKLVFLLAFFLLITTVVAQETKEIYFFYSETCPHCHAEMEFLDEIKTECSDIKINYYVASENKELFEQFAKEYNTTTTGVPRTFIGDKAFVGFSEQNGNLEKSVYAAYVGYQNQLRIAIDELRTGTECEQNESTVPTDFEFKTSYFLILALIAGYFLSYIILRKKIRSKKYWKAKLILIIIICLFIFIKSFSEVAIMDFAKGLPFPFFVFIVALADGFNPCAFTVLIILLSLLTYTKRKKDMLLIGMTFIITSAIMYFIFITVMILIGSWVMEQYSSIIMLVLGVGVSLAGLINLKDYFFFKKGVSLSMSDKDKLKFTSKARNITKKLRGAKDKRTIIIALLGTIALAIFVNLVELGCTAILPTIYMTALINSYGHSFAIMHVLFTLFYSFVYVIPLLVILLNFIYSFKSTRLTESQGRKLKLFSGLMMLVFGLLMIFAPNLLVFS